jgi:hypothetical protein
MGYSTKDIDVSYAKMIVKNWGWSVFEASEEKYFGNKKWRKDVIRAEAVLERPEIHLTLKNGDFVTVENTAVKGAN